jgi:hypothetical protein
VVVLGRHRCRRGTLALRRLEQWSRVELEQMG